jgi:hypothetical protein
LRDPTKGSFARRAASIIAVTSCDTRIFTKENFDTIVEDFPGLWMYLSHVAAEKYKMPELRMKAIDKKGMAEHQKAGRTAASAAILSQMTRIERVIGAMSKRISNIEKVMLAPKSPVMRKSSFSSNGSTGSATGPRRTSRSSLKKLKSATRKLSAANALSRSPSNTTPSQTPRRNSFNKNDI